MYCYLKKVAARPGNGVWWADFNAEGFGRKSLNLPESVSKETAKAAMARLYRGLVSNGSQMVLPAVAVQSATISFAEALDLWQPTHEAPTSGGEDYVKQYARVVRGELGNVPLADFAGRTGTLRMQLYRDELGIRGLSPKTRHNRISLVGQVLRFAVGEGLLAGLPVMPRARMKGEKTIAPVYDYIDETTFRALRGYIYSVEKNWAGTAAALWPAHKFPKLSGDDRLARLKVYIEARRLYLSLGYYTGMRTADLNGTIGADFSPDFGRHRRRSSKTGTKDTWLDSPEQLSLDVNAARLSMGGKFNASASVTGGTWLNVAVTMNDARDALGMSVAPTPRILRRSFVRQLALRGWPLNRVREHMGHSAESAMLTSVYQDCPEAPARCFKNVPVGGLDWTVESTRILEGARPHEGARVVSFPSPKQRGAGLYGDDE